MPNDNQKIDMEVKMKISDVIENDNNPRFIQDDKFLKLVKSLQDFPEMADVRPLIINQENIILGGNMRFKAMKEAGWKEVPTVKVDWSEEKQKKFVLLDNASSGDWDLMALEENWSDMDLADFGIEIGFASGDDFLFKTKPTTKQEEPTQQDAPRASSDDYSVFELIMKHENKLLFIQVLNKIKEANEFEKQEECLMKLVEIYHLKN